MLDLGALKSVIAPSHFMSWAITCVGGLVVMDALLWALEEGPLVGAALDVLPQEPPPAGHLLLDNPNVILTPHAAYYSLEAEEART